MLTVAALYSILKLLASISSLRLAIVNVSPFDTTFATSEYSALLIVSRAVLISSIGEPVTSVFSALPPSFMLSSILLSISSGSALIFSISIASSCALYSRFSLVTGICASINALASASVLSLTSSPDEAIIFSIPGLKASKSASDIAFTHLPIVTPSALILDEVAACA